MGRYCSGLGCTTYLTVVCMLFVRMHFYTVACDIDCDQRLWMLAQKIT